MAPEVSTITYIAYQYPGSFYPEESAEPIDMRDPQKHANEAPESAFAFFYFEVVVCIVTIDGERIKTRSDHRNTSKTYYFDAELLDRNAVSALPGDNTTLLNNMRCNDWDTLVRSRAGNFQPFEPAKHELLTKN
jgi:hypothetical protein